MTRRRLRLLAAASVVSNFIVLALQGCTGEVDRVFVDDLLDGSGAGEAAAGQDASGSTDGSSDGARDGDAPASDGPNDGEADASDGEADASDGEADASDGEADASDGEADASDGEADASDDAADASDGAADAAGDGGCGATTSITNCGACGNVCDTTTTSGAPLCNGTSCLYSCINGRFDCNNTSPNLDGCECAGGCCGTACQTAHSNGVGQTFYDCNPLGTYNEQQARAACLAFTGDAAQCGLAACVSNAGLLVCTLPATANCTCWKYAPGNSGVSGKVSTTCGCPVWAGATSWN